VGPVVAVVSFVCSIGNVPLAAVLWNGGISFGGVASFIFADLIILPILNIYRKYYGARMGAYLLVTFYATMVAAGLIVEVLFGALGLVPDERNAKVMDASVTWNYTTVLNLVFLALATVLIVRALRTGVVGMLRMMDRPSGAGAGDHADEHHHEGAIADSYTCPMHPEIRSAEPGKCPKCGMSLERR
jgi:uncharacterized membrane protein YraQ (UPF0718 family)